MGLFGRLIDWCFLSWDTIYWNNCDFCCFMAFMQVLLCTKQENTSFMLNLNSTHSHSWLVKHRLLAASPRVEARRSRYALQCPFQIGWGKVTMATQETKCSCLLSVLHMTQTLPCRKRVCPSNKGNWRSRTIWRVGSENGLVSSSFYKCMYTRSPCMHQYI